MPKHLLENAAAEREANDIGSRYMNSSDVLSDMIRDYGGALNGVKVHDDAAADAKVRAVGRDGLASGKDVYMREGSLSDGDPASKGLLAHELTHVMQQDGGMQESVDYGEAQGGLIDWFKSKFTKKGKAQAARAKQEAAFAAAMPSLGGYDTFDAGTMSQDVATLKPEMQSHISTDSQNIDVSDGNRFYFMRQGKKDDGTGRFNYFRHLKASGRKANIATMGDMAQGVEALPSVREFDTSANVHFKSVANWASGEEKQSAGMSDEEYAAKTARAKQAYSQYQSKGVDTIRAYLAHLSENPDAMEALRQSSQMYSDLGTYSDQNKKGLVGGRLEADHRAMNDMLLRSFGADSQLSSRGAKDTGLGEEDQDKLGVITQAILSMQATNLAQSMDPTRELNPQEAEMAQLFSDFFAQLHGDAPAGPAQQSAAPAPAQKPAAPFVPGQGPKETMSYRSDEIGALASDPTFQIDPTSGDSRMMAVIARKQYDKLKALQKSGADSATIQKAVEDFKEARARMSWA